MNLLVRLLTVSLVIAFVGCTGPKPPPGWPSGEERPINPSQVPKVVE